MDIDINRAWRSLQSLVDQATAALPNLVIALIVILLFHVAATGSRRAITSAFERSGHSKHLGVLVGRLFHVAVFVLGCLVSLSVLFPTFKASDLIQLLGISGVAIGFAFKDIFQNFLAGMLILLDRPFKVGDQIVFGGFEGVVEDIQARATLLQTFDNRRIVIPNSSLYTGSVSVTTAFEKRSADFTFGVDYDSNPENIGQIIREGLDPVKEVLNTPPPEVILTKISDGTLNVNVRWWFMSADYAPEVQDRVLRTILKSLADAGIKIKDPK